MSSSLSSLSESPSPPPQPSPRKRRRSSSAASNRPRKHHSSEVAYNDAYRLLYNEYLESTTGTREHGKIRLKPSQIGVSLWTASEKEALFDALEKLGKDNLPGLAAAVHSKSLPEIRQFMLLLQDAANRAGRRGISLQDIPPAAEIGVVCERLLDAAGDGLAVLQERYEAAQEQGRYGEHWLITTDLAEEIELAMKTPRASAPAESGVGEEQSADEGGMQGRPPLIQEIPEADLLIPKSFLQLSRSVFMNGVTSPAYPWPNWQDLTSEFADEPCMYRTALRDFHALVLSVTKRIVQFILIQATSRIRSQGWKNRSTQLSVLKRDVYAALDLLDMERSRDRYWRDLPRRCKLKVTSGKWRKTRVWHWDDVEHYLETKRTVRDSPGNFLGNRTDSNFDSEGPLSDAEKMTSIRAARSGTPRPPPRQLSSDDSNAEDEDLPEEHADSEIDQESEELEETADITATEDEESAFDSSEAEEEGLEIIDQELSRQEERKLQSMLGTSIHENMKAPSNIQVPSEERKRKILGRVVESDWRTWTPYHAEWEEYRIPVPTASFKENEKSPSPMPNWNQMTGYGTDYTTDGGRASETEDESRKKRPAARELPLRDARSYAALQGRQSESVGRHMGSDGDEDAADVPAQSIEGIANGIAES